MMRDEFQDYTTKHRCNRTPAAEVKEKHEDKREPVQSHCRHL